MTFMATRAGVKPQVRLTKENAAKLKKIVKTTRRTITQEANLAIEVYPVPTVYRDNGK